jgi:hypothetical protein
MVRVRVGLWRLAHLPHIEWQHWPQPRLRWRGVKEYREQHESCAAAGVTSLVREVLRGLSAPCVLCSRVEEV